MRKMQEAEHQICLQEMQFQRALSLFSPFSLMDFFLYRL